MKVLQNINELLVCADRGEQKDVHAIRDAALAWESDRIVWVGQRKEIPEELTGAEKLDARGRLVMPGLIDCHTHLIFGGSRAEEFTRKIAGRSYREIALSGGGLQSTVRATREMSIGQMVDRAARFLKGIRKSGVTTIEVKSGYGLNWESEEKMLKAAERLQQQEDVSVVPTFLGAHVIPSEYASNREAYVDLLVNEWIPKVAELKLAVFCDCFVEESAFTVPEAEKIFSAASKHGLKIKVHADQLSAGGGAELAARVGAHSADHLEYISDKGIASMVEHQVIGVNLPIAMAVVNPELSMPVRKCMDAGLQIAIASDFNPGSAPCPSLPLALWLACTLQRMTPAEVIKGATIYAAKALALGDEVGSIEKGKRADFCVMKVASLDELFYHFELESCERVFVSGEEQYFAAD